MTAPPPHRPTLVRVLNRLGEAVSPRWPALDPDNIVRTAAKSAKSNHFGDEAFRVALRILVDTVEREAKLTSIGRLACRQSLTMALEGRFGVYQYRAEHPEIAGVAIEKPIFIVGFPRTGTTVLFNLLAQDPSNRAPLGWETQFPNPPPATEAYATDPRIEKAEEVSINRNPTGGTGPYLL